MFAVSSYWILCQIRGKCVSWLSLELLRVVFLCVLHCSVDVGWQYTLQNKPEARDGVRGVRGGDASRRVPL